MVVAVLTVMMTMTMHAGEPSPTRTEALDTMLTLRRYVSTFDDPFARKLELMLGSFRQKTRVVEMQGMVNSKLTDYYSRT